MRNAVFQADCILRAYINTIANTDTPKSASIRTAIKHGGSFTGGNSAVISFFGSCFAISVTMYECDSAFNMLCLYTKNFGKIVCSILSPRNTKICFCLSISNSRRIIITSLISTSTSVNSRQTGTDFFYFFIFLYGKKSGNKRQKNSRK